MCNGVSAVPHHNGMDPSHWKPLCCLSSQESNSKFISASIVHVHVHVHVA